ncbi:MAG TPA: hypothetical protein VHD37_01435 [Candidatus Paceibacterota bacterium]|nr:hypothetical protein [Candidatus Paceibacterota bacterium]
MEQFFNAGLAQFSSVPAALYAVFYAAAALTGLVSLVLYYHWARYSVGVISVLGAFVLYTFGAAMLLASMFLAVRGLL